MAGPGSPGPGVGGWRLGPPRAELHRRGGERGAAGGRGDCCYGLVISAAPARVSPGPGGCSSPSTLSRGHGLVCGRGSCGGGGRGLGAVAFGEGGDHLPARRADPGHRPGRAAQRDPRGPGGRRHRLGGERGRSLASASRLVRPPPPHPRGRAVTSLPHPLPEAPRRLPRQVCGRGEDRWGAVAAGPQPARLPASSGPQVRRGLHLWFHSERSDTRHFIRLSPGTAFTPWKSHRRLPGSPDSLSPPPRTPWTHFQGTPRLLSFGDILILTLYTSFFLIPSFMLIFLPPGGGYWQLSVGDGQSSNFSVSCLGLTRGLCQGSGRCGQRG